jgi:Pyruvate/2-oxoacid:ferredoxin oxidoreductase delta subunit
MRTGRTLRHNGTRYIRFDQEKCRACWKCLEACPEQVFGKIRFPFHKHAVINHPDYCKGCRKCIKACPEKAIVPN